MSDSDSEGGPGLENILWGNLGEGDRLEADYMPKEVLGALGAVTNKTGLGAALRREVDDSAGSSAAASSGSAGGAAGRDRVQYIDEPTLPEDLEDDEFPVLQPAVVPAPAAAAAAAAAASHHQLAAAVAYSQRVAGEDDYDDEEDEEEDEPAAVGQLPAQLQQQHYDQGLQAPLSVPMQQYPPLQQVGGLHVPVLEPQEQQESDQQQYDQQQYDQQEPQQRQQPAFRRPLLTPEQEQLRSMNLATPAQEAQQEVLTFSYLDLDQLGEDIVHFSELYVPTDNQVKHAYLTSFARAPPSAADKQHDQPWERARQRADAQLNRHYQQKALQAAGADADVADNEAQKFHRGDIAAAAAEGNVVQLGLQNIRQEVVEELSDAEEELFASDPQGLGRAMLQAERLNAIRAAAKAAAAAIRAAQAKAAATAGDADAAAEAAAEAEEAAEGAAEGGADGLHGLTAGMQGLGLKGLAVNPHALDALQADILPDWEQDVFWGSASAPVLPPPPPAAAVGALTAPLVSTSAPALASVQLQQQTMVGAGSLGLSGMQPSAALPGMSTAMSGLPPAGHSMGFTAAPSGLPGSLSAMLPAASLLPGAASLQVLGQGAAGVVGTGQYMGMGWQAGQQDPAAAAALGLLDPAAAAAGAGGEGAGEQDRQGGAKAKGGRLGKPKKPLPAALADLKLHRQMLRLMPSIAAVAAAQAAAEAADAAAAAAAAAAASGDRAAAAALPQHWGGSKGAGGPGSASAEAAAAAEQLKLRHVGDLLQRDLRPVLPDDDDWLNDVVWDAQEAAATGALQQQQQQLARSVSNLAAGFEHVGLDGQQQALVVRGPGGRAAVLWDLNDPYMVFEAHSTQQYVHASAMMHLVPPQAAAAVPPHLQGEKDPLLRQLAPLHISRDYLYQASERTSGRAVTTGRHSFLAITLSTVPVFPKDAMSLFWHRPRSWWNSAHFLYCLEEERRTAEYQQGRDPDVVNPEDPFKFEPIGLNLRKGFMGSTPSGGTVFEEVCNFIKKQRAFKDAFSVEEPLMRSFGPGYDFAAVDDKWMGCWLSQQDKSLAELGFRRGINYIIPVWTQLSPLKTGEVAVLLPPDVPCRPPAAFKTIKSLSAAQPGHVLLLEYLEQRPLMMLQTGMGVRLTTYYRRRNDSDLHYQALQAEYTEGLQARHALPVNSADRVEARPPWMVGTAQLLTPDDPSPFYELAPIPPGEMQFAVDTPCFRAPAVPHVASYTDFLLVRLQGGNIALRELTGCVAVGQQHPSVPIWAPMSEQAVTYERARFKVWVIKTLRARAERPAVKAGTAIPTVSLQELQAPNMFGSMSISLTDPHELARLLKDECQCMPVPEKPGHWTFMPNAKLPSDQDLKKMVTPDQAVQYEALLAGIGQRDQYNIGGLADQILKLLHEAGAGPATTLRLVLDMLFPDAAGKQAAAAIEQCVLNTPWAQAAAYHSALVQDVRNPTPLTLVGRGDPTGRGKGFAFVKDDPKRVKDEAAPPAGLQAQADGTITGTGADLRRLSHKRAGEILETKFGMDPNVVAGIPRWDRIDAIRKSVRDPANAALVNADPELQQWVRNIKMSAEDMRSRMRNMAAPIFAKQMNALLEPWDDGAESAELSWGLQPQLATAAEADASADTATSQARLAAEQHVAFLVSQEPQDPAAVAAAEQARIAAYDEHNAVMPLGPGLYYGPPRHVELPPVHRLASGATRGLPRGHKPVPGERRIRRVIKYATGNQSYVQRVIYIYSREEMAALNALYKAGEGFVSRNVTMSTDKRVKYKREVSLAQPFREEWPNPTPDLPPQQGQVVAAAAAAAAAAGAAAAAPDAAYWAAPGADGAAAAAAGGYGGYAPAQEAAAWAPQQQVVAQPTAPRAPKLSKKQQKQAQQAAKRAAAAARKSAKRRRRDDDYEFSDDDDDEELEISASDDSEVMAAAEGSDEGDGSPARKKKARPQRAAAASGGGADAGAAAPFAAAAAGGAIAALPAAPTTDPPDTAVGAADGADQRMLLALQQLNHILKTTAFDKMVKFQASKRIMTKFLENVFLNRVTPNLVADYAAVVPEDKQMWLNRIAQRLRRNFYSNRQQLLADAQMIVDAASMYHNPNRRGAQYINPNIPKAGASMVQEGVKVLEEPTTKSSLDYWEGRLAVEFTRMQGLDQWRQYFQTVLATAQQAYTTNNADIPFWHWIACDECKRWRLLSDYCFYTLRLEEEGAAFKCGDNLDWPEPSCNDAPHWAE